MKSPSLQVRAELQSHSGTIPGWSSSSGDFTPHSALPFALQHLLLENKSILLRNPSHVWCYHEEFWECYSFPIISVIFEAFRKETAERIMKVWKKTLWYHEIQPLTITPTKPHNECHNNSSFLDSCSDNKRSSLQAKLPSEFSPLLWRVLLSSPQSSCHKSCALFSPIHESFTTTHTAKKWEEEEHPGIKTSPGQGRESQPHTGWAAVKTQSPTLLWQLKAEQTEKSRQRIISVGKTLVFIPLLIHKEGFIC